MAEKSLQFRCEVEWKTYRDPRAADIFRPRPLSLGEDWGLQSLRYYKSLSRPQCTMLLHCRTGFIGLRGHLNQIAVEPTSVCPLCYAESHTVEHLFLYCENRDMTRKRNKLHRDIGEARLKAIFTEHPLAAARLKPTLGD